MTQPYRPATDIEGDMFMRRFCDRCVWDNGCVIPALTLEYPADDPRYPVEWVRDGAETRCMGFGEKT